MSAVKKPAVRVVGKRIPPLRHIDDIPDDFRTDIESEDDFQDPVEERRVLALNAIERLSPSSFSTFIQLGDAIPEDLRRKIAGGHHLCLITRLPSKVWIHAAHEAVETRLKVIEADLGVDIVTTVALKGRDRHFGDREADYDLDGIVHALARQHVVVPLLPDEILDGTITAIADLEISLYPTAESLRRAIHRRFDDADARPEDVDPRLVSPSALDLACKRAASSTHAFELLERLSVAAARKSEEEGAKKEAEEQKKADEEARKRARNASTTILRPVSPTLGELHGYGAAALWAQDLVRDLADYRQGKLGWADVDSGCLLYGPPGTGKTLFAGAVAASAGLPFVSTSYADWQSQGSGHAGDVIKSIRQRFADANANAPCVLFIDEMDTVGSRGAGGGDRYDEWFTMIITALLECLDGMVRREGVVVLAASNHPSKIDPALLRSGRLDRRFEVGLPDEDALARIFAHHLPGGDVSAFERVATVLAGTTSGADVSRIAREARRAARRAGREIEAEDLLAIAMPPCRLSDRDRRLVAVHEAGHAVAMIATGQIPDSLSLVASQTSHGGVVGERMLGMGRVSEIENEIVRMLAGRAAEEVILGEPSGGAANDLANATHLVKGMVGTHGLGGRLMSDGQVVGSDVESRLRELYGRALRLVGQHRQAVEDLASIAVDRRVLGRRALVEFAQAHGFEVRS